MNSALTLMAVHAHPDDESTTTGGILAHYALQSVRTVVVTCTNGELGDGPGGVKPGEGGHDPLEVAAIRIAELRSACAQLGVSDLEVLGYHDSGMVDWSHKDRPDVFCNVPIDVAAARVASLVAQYRPQVVVTYDPDGSYQHPDHVHAARVAAAAVEASGIPAKLYFKAHGTTYWRRLRWALAQVGIERPEPSPELARTLAAVEGRIAATVDVSRVVGRKRAGLHAHASQLNSSLAAKLPPELFAHAFSAESYLRGDRADSPSTVENDLFAGA